MRTYFQFTVWVILALLHIPHAYAATEITGTVTAKRGDSVQVTFQPHETAGPKVGDAVSFSKEIPGTGGIKAKAGEGSVTEVEGSTVWVKTSDSRPNLKMDAIIQATGNAAAQASGNSQKAGKLGVNIFTYTLSPEYKRRFSLPEDLGVVGVTDVAPYSAAAKAGILKDDFITEFNGVKVHWASDLALLAYTLAPGTEVQVKIIRNDREERLSLIMGEGEPRSDSMLYYLKGKAAYSHGDHNQALKWLTKAAELGDAEAQYLVGRMHDWGQGVPEDGAEATKWYRKAAAQNHEDAKRALWNKEHTLNFK